MAGIKKQENKDYSSNWGGKRSNSGGARVGAGRPKGSLSKGEKHTGRIVIVCLESEEAKIKELATQSGKSVSRFIVDTILQN